jgi:hypothetical protein
MPQVFLLSIGLLSLVAVTEVTAAPLPHPWKRSLFDLGPNRVGADSIVRYDNEPSLFINAAFPPPGQKVGPGRYTAAVPVTSGVSQTIKADRYRGKIMRWSAYMRTEEIGSVWDDNNQPPEIVDLNARVRSISESGARSPGAGLYAMIDSPENTLLYTMTRDRLIGTHGWTKVELYLDVSPQSALITIGFFLASKGKLWVSGFRFEEVTAPYDEVKSLDLTNEQQTYDYLIARHKKRMKDYSRSPYAPVLQMKRP